ncbi:hypothetical protein PLICRDRAFT_399373 [Plicaturopsis crispa FD-325 SS-3]|nr:hypothetical protein PLICRDRAFT_399373 [Plicaturopsis crispa FD-325 SS-3]
MLARISLSSSLRFTAFNIPAHKFAMSTKAGTAKDPNANASGLTPEVSRALEERTEKLQPHEERIVRAIKEMYGCKPQADTFDVYTTDGVFHDPVGYAQGAASVRAQFVGLAKLFPRADLPKFRVLANPLGVPDSTILIDQDVAYYRNAESKEPTKTVNSLLTLETDGAHLVTRHTEEWDHNKQTLSEDGFFGMLNEARKKTTAGLTDMFVGKT